VLCELPFEMSTRDHVREPRRTARTVEQPT
jgi:hypothetical protein